MRLNWDATYQLSHSPWAFVYALVDPMTKEVRYVGQARDLIPRYRRHVSDAAEHQRSEKERWIKGLLDLGHKPMLTLLERVPKEDLSKAERKWIFICGVAGARLTNALVQDKDWIDRLRKIGVKNLDLSLFH